jgi:hypothetical protein
VSHQSEPHPARAATDPPPLRVRIKKHADGSAALTLVRADGSTTWQRQTGAQGRFFPLHDLTHFAVETELGFDRGFFGLVAEGWEIGDFAAPWPRGRIPAESGEAELIVGFLDSERASGGCWSAEEFNARAADYMSQHGGAWSRQLTDAELDRVRDRRRELFSRWNTLPAGEALELEFRPTPAPS